MVPQRSAPESRAAAFRYRGAALSVLLLAAAFPVWSDAPSPLHGSVSGLVSDLLGTPQMGVSVGLYDRMDRLVGRTLTNARGEFGFESLATGRYSVRISAPSFLTVMRPDVLVQAGARSLLSVNLSSFLSTIELVYPEPGQRSLMSEDWKWVLRTASATRPVLRFMPGWDHSPARPYETSMFSDTRGIVRVSAGEGGLATAAGNESDLGTAFAMATSLFGRNHVELAGNVGYASQSGLPSAGFRTSYSRGSELTGSSPEVSLTMRQLFIPGRTAGALGGGGGVPALRTMSLSVDDGIQISDFARFDYGFSLDSVAFFDRLNYASPYARLTQELGQDEAVIFSYASGMPQVRGDGGLQDDLRSLSMFPRVSRTEDRARVQRAETYEIAYKRRFGDSSVQVATFREAVTNAALLLGGAGRLANSPNLLPDLFSNSAVFNGGDYGSTGYSASMAHEFADWMTLTLVYATGGALLASQTDAVAGSPDDLRSMIHQGRRRTVTTQVGGRSPYTGTHFVASYQWASRRAATPGHVFATQNVRGDAGVNFFLRQPLPSPSSFPVRVEATADLRNAFGEGYIPIQNREGSALVLMNTPRSVRGGLSFIF